MGSSKLTKSYTICCYHVPYLPLR